MATSYNPRIITNGLVLALDAANFKSFRGEPTTNVFTHYGTPGEGSSGDVNVTFSVQGTGTFIRLGHNQNYGGYVIQPGDVVYRYNLGTSGCHYHGNTVSIPSGSTATFSFDYYVSPETTIEDTFLANFENYGGGAFGGSVSANGRKGVWQRVSFTSGPATANGTLAMFLYPGGCSPSRFGNTGYILYKNPQVEFKSYSTPFVNGTRGTDVSTGGGWSDLSGNGNHGDILNGPTFNSSNGGGIVFDGVDDYINCGSGIQLINNFTLEVWHRNINTGYIIDQGNIGQDPTGCLEYTNRGLSLSFNNGESVTANGTFSDTTRWNHVTCTFNSGTTNFYINGIFDSTKTTTTTTFSPSGILKIGRRAFSTSSIMSGTIGLARIYNRVLSETEILQNFNASRSRFGV